MEKKANYGLRGTAPGISKGDFESNEQREASQVQALAKRALHRTGTS